MSPEARSAEGVIPERLAAFGFLARGIVYLLIGGIAARVAILQRGRATGPAGALAKILTGPGGRLVLWVVVAGLFAFVLFRVTQCVHTRRPLLLAGYVGSALGGLVLAITAVRVLLHFGARRRRGGAPRPGREHPLSRRGARRARDSEARSPPSPGACRPSGRPSASFRPISPPRSCPARRGNGRRRSRAWASSRTGPSSPSSDTPSSGRAPRESARARRDERALRSVQTGGGGPARLRARRRRADRLRRSRSSSSPPIGAGPRADASGAARPEVISDCD